LGHVIVILDWALTMHPDGDVRAHLQDGLTALIAEPARLAEVIQGYITFTGVRVQTVDGHTGTVVYTFLFPFNQWWLRTVGGRLETGELSGLIEGWNVGWQGRDLTPIFGRPLNP
jgi:hypothetical protein